MLMSNFTYKYWFFCFCYQDVKMIKTIELNVKMCENGNIAQLVKTNTIQDNEEKLDETNCKICYTLGLYIRTFP